MKSLRNSYFKLNYTTKTKEIEFKVTFKNINISYEKIIPTFDLTTTPVQGH